MTGSIRYVTPQRSSAAMLGSSVSRPWPKSGITTTRVFLPAKSRATSRLDWLTDSTSSAPAATAVPISPTSKESTLTRIPAPTSSRTTSASSGKARPDHQEARDPRGRHQRRHGDLHNRDVVGERGRHFGERAAERRLGELARDEEHSPGSGFRRGGRHRGSPDRTNLFGVPSRAPPFGRHSTDSSILRASSKSLSVIPPAAWFWSFTITPPHVTDRSGWWYAASEQ